MEIHIVAALACDSAIGKKNKLPWQLPKDLMHFKALTLDAPILMGRKTWESLPGLLPRRQHIVISRSLKSLPNALVFGSIEEALEKLREEQSDKVFCIGGGEIYAQMLPLSHYAHLCRVETSVEDADSFFPPWPQAGWHCLQREEHKADAKHAFDFCFELWARV